MVWGLMVSGRGGGVLSSSLMTQLLLLLALTPLVVEETAANLLASSQQQLVQLQEGWVRGHASQTVYGYPYVSFSGIPYAVPPTGPLRFKPPVPKTGWNGTLNASTEGSPCPQVNDSGVYLGNEDCLYLNVYVPQVTKSSKSSALLKVMVFIHGGGFVQGESGRTQFGPDFLVERGVILVTFNYRLGVLGFLSLETEAVPGNYGLKDQRLALQWVQRNIQAFGGDPDDITLFGESAGASSVHYHLLSNSSWGLFSRAIAQSGSALSPWAFSRTPRQRALSLVAALGLPENSSDDFVLGFLMQERPVVLANNTKSGLSERDTSSLFTFAFVPSVEPVHEGAILTEEPVALLAKGHFLKIPYITGVNSKEGNFFVSGAVGGSLSTNESLDNFNNNFEAIVGPELRVSGNQTQYETAKNIRSFYYGNDAITREKDLNTSNLLTDLYFEEPVDRVVRIMAAASSELLRQYRFSFKGPNTAVQDEPGVPHAEDLKYLFHTVLSKLNLDRNSDEGRTRDRMVEMWTNFAKYGDPTPNVTTLLTTTWKAYTTTDPYFLDIDTDLGVNSSLDKERMDFWNGILPP